MYILDHKNLYLNSNNFYFVQLLVGIVSLCMGAPYITTILTGVPITSNWDTYNTQVTLAKSVTNILAESFILYQSVGV